MVVSSYMSHAEATKYRSVVFARFTPFNLLDPPSPPFAPIKLNCTPNLVPLVKVINRSVLRSLLLKLLLDLHCPSGANRNFQF